MEVKFRKPDTGRRDYHERYEGISVVAKREAELFLTVVDSFKRQGKSGWKAIVSMWPWSERM